MKNKIEDKFDPPFAYYKHAVSGYVVRPLNWEGIWKDEFIFVGGNTMLNCSDEEDAKIIADTFNRFFELLKENKQLKLENEKLDNCLTEYTSLYREELDKNTKAEKYIKNNSHKTEWGDELQNNESIDINDDITDTEFIETLLNILRGEDNE